MSRDRMDRTAAGICYSYGISQVLLKVAIKFKNANLLLNVIVKHFPQTILVISLGISHFLTSSAVR